MTDDVWFGVTPEPIAKYVHLPFLLLTLLMLTSITAA